MSGFTQGFLRVAVETTVPWPTEEQVLDFQGHQITVSPETDRLFPTVMVPFTDPFTQELALTLLHEFATALAWTEGQPVNLTLMTATTVPTLMLGKPPPKGAVGLGRFDYLPRSNDPKTRLAMALYREGLTANLPHHRFLAFFRIINLHIPTGGKDQIAWVNAELPHLTDPDAKQRLAVIASQHQDVGNYLYVQDRCAAAHASLTQTTVNPDDPSDGIRLAEDLPIVRALAARIIEHHLGVKTLRTFRREHLYELDGFRAMLRPDVLAALKRGEHVPNNELPVPSTISIRLRGHAPFDVFENLTTSVLGARQGVVWVRGRSPDGLVVADVLLDFPDERLRLDPQNYAVITDDGSLRAAQHALGELLFWRHWWPANGTIEVWTGGKLIGRTDPYMPPLNSRFDPEGYEAELRKREEMVRARGGTVSPHP